MINVTPVILCGGSGSRLWPLSREGFPKQFLILSGQSSLYQQSLDRINKLKTVDIRVDKPIIVTNEDHRFLAYEQTKEIQGIDASFLLEPMGRNTAPALTLAALKALDNGEDPILVVSPSDQYIKNCDEFTKSLQKAIRIASADVIVILGVTPDCPETGFGYIKHAKESNTTGGISVLKFEEKPHFDLAQHYVDSGNYVWNSGLFVLRASVWLNSIKQFRPDILTTTEASWAARTIDGPFIRPDKHIFSKVPSESIDYAVIEKCPESSVSLYMVPLDAGWSDLGAWGAVWNNLKDTTSNLSGNVFIGDTLAVDSHDSLIFASNRLVGVVGVKNLIVIETADAVLVVDRQCSQDVRKLVNILEKKNRRELKNHRKVHRPWGWYDSIDEDERFKVKRIQVKPGASLSLQMHHHRAEHWIVVKGTAEITNGKNVMILTENQSTYIPLGEVHRLANPGTIPLEIIEVQSGSYLGEDDIVRYEDSYGRTKEE